MTREEAAEILKNVDDNIKYDAEYGVYFTHEWVGAYEMAISALREQSLGNEKQATETSDKKTSEGCEYCTDSENIYEIKSPIHDSYNTDVYISEDALIVDIGCHSYGASKIKFCPMCGRRLEEV